VKIKRESEFSFQRQELYSASEALDVNRWHFVVIISKVCETLCAKLLGITMGLTDVFQYLNMLIVMQPKFWNLHVRPET